MELGGGARLSDYARLATDSDLHGIRNLICDGCCHFVPPNRRLQGSESGGDYDRRASRNRILGRIGVVRSQSGILVKNGLCSLA